MKLNFYRLVMFNSITEIYSVKRYCIAPILCVLIILASGIPKANSQERSPDQITHSAIDKKDSLNKNDRLNKDDALLKIAIMKNNPPFSLILPNGRPTGLYVDIWKNWSEVTNIKIEFVAGTYTENIEALRNGKADFHSGLFANPERAKWAVFSLPINRNGTGLFFNGDELQSKTLEQLSGKKIGVGKGTFQETFLNTNYPNIKVVTFDFVEETIDALLNQEIDAILSENAFINAQLAKLGIMGAFDQSEKPVMTNTSHALIPKDKAHLKTIIDDGIRKLPIEKIIKLEKKWLPREEPFFETIVTSLVPSLTQQEQEWLAIHNKFIIGIDHAWAPFEFVDEEGKHSGISSVFVEKLSEQLSIDTSVDNESDWSELLKKIERKEIDILPAVARSKERDSFILFSDPYLDFSNVVVTRNDAEYAQELADLDGKTIAVVKGYRIQEILEADYPRINTRYVKNIGEGLALVESGEVFGYIDNLAIITHEQQVKSRESLRVAVYTPYKDKLSFGVRKGLEPLLPIINKALANIDNKERKAIINEWLAVRVNVGFDFLTIVKWGAPVLLFFMLIIGIVTRANRKLQVEIDKRRKTERRLNEAKISAERAKETAEKANKAKDEFLANMSHEIRTPMNAVLGMSQLLVETPLNNQQKEYIETLNTSAESLLNLINDILDLSKVEAGKLELENIPFSLNKVVNNIVKQTEVKLAEKPVDIRINFAKDIPSILIGDGLRVGQILLNISGNAAKFTAEGYIDIKVHIKSVDEKSMVLQFEVKDTGIGMTANQLKKLFQTYSQADSSTTREYGGTGLGLAISKNLVALMGGEIWVESEFGEGSVFYFTCELNVSSEKIDQSAQNLIRGSVKPHYLDKLKNKNILLVDDNPVNLMVAKKMLTNSGMNVVTAANGLESIEKLQENDIDAVFMDVQMPVMDGYDATKTIRQNIKYKDLPIIALSANAMEKDIKKGLEVGMNAHLAKPVKIEQMLEVLDKYIREDSQD